MSWSEIHIGKKKERRMCKSKTSGAARYHMQLLNSVSQPVCRSPSVHMLDMVCSSKWWSHGWYGFPNRLVAHGSTHHWAQYALSSFQVEISHQQYQSGYGCFAFAGRRFENSAHQLSEGEVDVLFMDEVPLL